MLVACDQQLGVLYSLHSLGLTATCSSKSFGTQLTPSQQYVNRLPALGWQKC
jgi:hypothetical protein